MIIYPSSISGLQRQPGSKMITKVDGTMEAILILEGDSSLASSVPAIDSRHPDNSLLTAHNVEVENTKLGKIRATVSYVGVSIDPTPWFLEGNGSLDKESILTNPNFVSNIAGTADSPLNGALFNSDGTFDMFSDDSDLAGCTDWFVPRMVYRLTRSSFTSPDISNLGKIVSPPISIYAPSSCNFLQGPITFKQIGSLYQITNEIWASGENGWSEDIYGT